MKRHSKKVVVLLIFILSVLLLLCSCGGKQLINLGDGQAEVEKVFSRGGDTYYARYSYTDGYLDWFGNGSKQNVQVYYSDENGEIFVTKIRVGFDPSDYETALKWCNKKYSHSKSTDFYYKVKGGSMWINTIHDTYWLEYEAS